MRNQALTFVVFLLILASCTENDLRNSLTEDNIKGKVSTLIVYEYAGVDLFGEIQKGEFTMTTISNYDDQGRLREMSTYKSDSLAEKQICLYDTVGHPINILFNDSAESKITYRIFTCDSIGNIIQYADYSSIGEITAKVTRKNDKKGNKIESVRYDAGGNMLLSMTFDYDKKGNCTEFRNYDVNRNLVKTTIRKCNDEGNMVFSKFSTTNGKERDSVFYTYSGFDRNGNWLKKVGGGKIFERNIEYYSKGEKYLTNALKSDSTNNLSQENAEKVIRHLISSNDSINVTAITAIEPIYQFTETTAGSIVHYNYRGGPASSPVLLKCNFKKNADSQWFLNSVVGVSGIGLQEMSGWFSKWQNLHIPVQ
jgi:hypothetical protein